MSIKPKQITGIFPCYIAKVLPLAFDESMSYYECLCAMLKYLNEQVVPEFNNAIESFNELQSFVDHYFDNLDVQEEINNKLDEMAESGQLTDIIAQYLGLAGMITFNTIADMKLAENLVNGSKCRTLGYHSINDKGGAYYRVRNITNEDTVDESTIIALYDVNLIAELILESEMSVECFGAYGDNTHDDSDYLQIAINSNCNTLLFSNKTYLIEKNITLKDKIYLGNDSKLVFTNNTQEHIVKNEYFGDLDHYNYIIIKNINFEANVGRSILGFSSASVTIENCNFNSDDLNVFIDLYGNNSNCLVNNCKMVLASEDLTDNGDCIRIRGFYGGHSKNIKVTNCYMETNTIDETVWINAGLCSIENVEFNNCIIYDKGNSGNTLWISNSASSGTPLYIKNVLFENCTIIKDTITSRVITVGTTEGTNYSTLDNKNIKFNNCDIIVNDSSSSSNTHIIKYGPGVDSSVYEPVNELTISNSKITYTGSTTNIYSAINGFANSINNKIIANHIRFCYLQINKAFNDDIVSDQVVARDVKTLENLTINSTGSSVISEDADHAKYKDTTIKNCNINCSVLIAISSQKGRTYRITNNKINNSSYILNNYGGDTTNILYFSDNYINSKNIVNNQNCTLYFGNNYDASGLIKGIIGNVYTKGSFVIGSIMFSNNATKTIYRKISDGNTDSNWEEI